MMDAPKTAQRLFFVAMLMALGALGAPARANLDLDEMASVMAVPFFTGPGLVTEIVITNGLAESVELAFQVINGDVDEAWETASFKCQATAFETTRIRVEEWTHGSQLKFECSTSDASEESPPADLNVPRLEVVTASRGILFVAVEDGGVTSSKNGLFGSATVIDAVQGSAYSMNAMAFQGLDPLAQDGDKQYRFDGLEYAQFPAALSTNFLAPDETTSAELLLFTLDGTVDNTPVPVALRVFFYNDDELERDANLHFDCMDVIPLEDVDPRMLAEFLGSKAGHITLSPRAVSVTGVHEATGSGIDGVRITPAHGWLVQTYVLEDAIATTARSLAQSVNSHVPMTGDITNFNAH